MKYFTWPTLALIVVTRLSLADTCEEQLDHVLSQNQMVARVASMYRKPLTRFQVLALDSYEYQVRKVNPDLNGCPIEVDSKLTIRAIVDNLAPCVTTFKVNKYATVAVGASEPVIRYDVQFPAESECPLSPPR